MVPIVLFVYRRVHSARTLLEVLISGGGMDDHPLYIFSDAPKNDSERGEVEIVRQYIKDVSGFKELHIVEAVSHKGLARSVIEGVSMVLLEHDSVIVLEDDLIPQPGFMDYMCRALDFYKNDRLVFSISGFSFGFVPPQGYRHDVYALTRGCSWGWATWRDRWEAVDWNTRTYVDLLEDRAFWRSLTSSGSDLGPMLLKQDRRKVDSWAIRCYCHQVRHALVTIYPVHSLVLNIGFDDMATHTNVYNRYRSRSFPHSSKRIGFVHIDGPDSYFQKALRRKFSIARRMVEGRILTFLKRIGVFAG